MTTADQQILHWLEAWENNVTLTPEILARLKFWWRQRYHPSD